MSDTLGCPNCLTFGHVLGDCPQPRVKDERHAAYDLCSACERDSLACSKDPCDAVREDRGWSGHEWHDGQLVVLIGDPLRYDTVTHIVVPTGTVGRVHSGDLPDNDLPDSDGDLKVFWPQDPAEYHYTHESNLEPVVLPPTDDNDALEAWLEGVST